MAATTLLSLVLTTAQVAVPAQTQALAPSVQEARTSRPAAPYSLAPVTGLSRDGSPVPRLVPPDAPPAVEQQEVFADDGVPLPNPPVVRETPGGDVLEQPASGDPFFLGFAAGRHHPPVGELVDQELYANALTSYPDGRPAPETYAFVMFSKRMTPERLAQLEALGCRLLGFHPHYTQKVALPAVAVDQVSALDFVRWVGVPRTWQKVHPALSDRLAEVPSNEPVDVWVSVFESDVGPESVPRPALATTTVDPGNSLGTGSDAVLPGIWVTNGWQQRELEGIGMEVIDFNERARVFRARMMPQGLDLVTALDFVQFVELDVVMRPLHDESMPMVNADDVRSFFDGGTTAVAGIVDSGVETSHQDLNFVGVGANISGSATGGPFDDTCGHGTHVAGTILGEGLVEAGHRGCAPDLGNSARPFYSLRIFDTCASQPVDESAVVGFMSTVGPKPHVINNSWGSDGVPGAPWVGSETEARIFDDTVYYDAQLHVFAAGNDGPLAGTLGLPAVAKNVLTVGNVIDYKSSLAGLPGALWNGGAGSSRGPCGDGRWKPNLVAPGRWITSADAANPGGYKTFFGTSMAAPHVTGIVADMIDALPGFAKLPEVLSSLTMGTATRKNGAQYSTPMDSMLDEYGAGRIDGTSAIWDSSVATRAIWSFSLAAGSSTYGDFTVPSGATRLVAVMHYADPPASAGASQALVNDWDLWIDQPPLAGGNNSGEWSAQQSGIDNTEIRVLASPIAGNWRWKLWPDSTTTKAYFGVTIFVETGDTTPAISPGFVSSHQYARPAETVRFDYSLTTPGAPLSSVFLEAGGASANLTKAETYLKDGVVTDLLGNPHGGWSMGLGDVHPLFSRSAAWELFWGSEGSKTFSVKTRSDNASNDGHVYAYGVTVDGTPPNPPTNVQSSSHSTGVWSNDDTVDMVWNVAVDPISGGVASGLDGYNWSTTNNNPGSVSQTKTLSSAQTGLTTPALGNGIRWFNMRAVDRAGNWGPVASAGPYYIDWLQPTTITGLASMTHQAGLSSCNPTVTMTWDDAVDNGASGIAGYSYVWNHNPAGFAPTTLNVVGTTQTTTLPSSTQPWYFHVRAVDVAGNSGNQMSAGPFLIDPDPTTIYCVAKTNSQGCTPKIGSTGSPSLSGGSFVVTASEVLNNKSGLLFWGYTPSSTPFQGGTKCVANPVKRTPIQNSAGDPPPDNCSGTHAFNFSTSYMNAKGVGVGDTIHAQWWTRDSAAPFSTGLTDALSFTVCP